MRNNSGILWINNRAPTLLVCHSKVIVVEGKGDLKPYLNQPYSGPCSAISALELKACRTEEGRVPGRLPTIGALF